MKFPVFRALYVLHIFCYYRLASLLPNHPAKWPLVIFQWLIPSAWFGPYRKSEGERLQLAFTALGPIFIKFGQLLATRRDMLPDEWIDALAQLQDQVKPFSSDAAMKRLEAELGQPIGTVFKRFNAKPMASASIAQVHSGELHDGTQVVAKIRRPGLAPIVTRDLQLMRTGARWLERVWKDARYFRPTRAVQDYQDIIEGELDLRMEGSNSEIMRRHFLFSPLLHIPKIHSQYTTERLLIIDRINGIPVNDIEAIKQAGINPKELAERGVEIFFKQVFTHNFFHADMHPGNIFVNPESAAAPQYMSIDCAIVGRLSQADLLLLGRLVLAVMREDFEDLTAAVIRAGWSTAPIDPVKLERAIRHMLEPMLSQPLDQLEFAPLVLEIFELTRRFHIEAPLQYILLLKTLVHIEGLGRSIYPKLDIWSIGRPLLEKRMLEIFGPAATMKKLQERAPEWLAQLPEMPDKLREALDTLQQQPFQQQRMEQKMQAMQQDNRRKLLLGLAGIGLFFTAVSQWQAPGNWIAGVAGAFLFWRAL